MEQIPTVTMEHDSQNEKIDKSNVVDSHNSQCSRGKRANSDCKQHPSKEPETKKQRLVNKSLTSIFDSSNDNVIQKVKSITDLPPEMIDTILSNAATFDLLNCRRVNRQWNEISSRIIRSRYDIILHFELIGGEFVHKVHLKDCENRLIMVNCKTSRLGVKNLNDLLVCLNGSKHFPFTNYRFDAISGLKSQKMQSFLVIFGSEVRSLKVTLRHSGKCSEVIRGILCWTPNLKELEIELCRTYKVSVSSIGLLVGSHQWQLPKLETLRVEYYCRKLYPKIMEDILRLSPNMKIISIDGCTALDFKMLQSTKKFHCLKHISTGITKNLIEFWKNSPERLELQYLSLTICPIFYDHQLKLEATKMLNEWLRSSNGVIQSFRSQPLGSLEGLVLPKMEKLQKLQIHENLDGESILPASCDWMKTFPNVKELSIVFMSDSIGVPLLLQPLRLPTIEILRISTASRHILTEMLKITPNVKTLLIEDDYGWRYDAVANGIVSFEDISTYLPKLENLGWQLRRPHYHAIHKLDAVITGLPENVCKQLAETFHDKDRLSAMEVSLYQQKRNHSTILGLKELRRFEMDVVCEDDDTGYSRSDSVNLTEWQNIADLGPDTRLYGTCGFTKVSKLLGFDLMPNLNVFVHINFHH